MSIQPLANDDLTGQTGSDAQSVPNVTVPEGRASTDGKEEVSETSLEESVDYEQDVEMVSEADTEVVPVVAGSEKSLATTVTDTLVPEKSHDMNEDYRKMAWKLMNLLESSKVSNSPRMGLRPVAPLLKEFPLLKPGMFTGDNALEFLQFFEETVGSRVEPLDKARLWTFALSGDVLRT
jgi:hypothetical protein